MSAALLAADHEYMKRARANVVHAVGAPGEERVHLLRPKEGKTALSLCGVSAPLGGWRRRSPDSAPRCQACARAAGVCMVEAREPWGRSLRERDKRFAGLTAAQVDSLSVLASGDVTGAARGSCVSFGRLRALGLTDRTRKRSRDPWTWQITDKGAAKLAAAHAAEANT